MKILRISLRNIASLEGTHTVDFTRDPLRAAGLFAISGITGSGKSTLLDALCLALYERTPRLNAVRGAVKLADAGESISQKDPANLLRRGTGEGFAEVAFVGVDNATYTARWTVRRARNRPDGALQNTEITLFRGDIAPGVNGVIERGGKKGEVLPVIAAKVGLTFEQFTRAVLLAQNDFATFLKADDRERAEILQALTGTARFEAISIAVFNRASGEQRAVSDLENLLAGYAPLAVDARANAESACADAEKAWKEASEMLAAREAHAEWFHRLGLIAKDVSESEACVRETIDARDAAAPRRIELSLTEEASRDARPLRDAEHRLRAEHAAATKSRDAALRAEGTARTDHTERKLRHAEAMTASAAAQSAMEKARPLLLQARELDAKLAPLTERCAAATRDRESVGEVLKQATTARDAIRGKRDTADGERTSLAPQRTALAAFAAYAPEASAWLQRLDHAVICRQSLDAASEQVAIRTSDEKGKAAASEIERANEAIARKAAAAASAAFEQAEIAAKAYDGEKIAQARSKAEAGRMALRELAIHLHELDTVSVQAASVATEIATSKAANEADARTLVALQDQQIPEAEKAEAAACRAFSLAEAAVADEAIRLREKLVAGQPCPVCGAVDHPHAEQPPAHEAAVLQALRGDCATREMELRRLRESAVRLDAARTTRLGHEAEKGIALAALKTRLVTLCAARHEHPAAVALLALPVVERAAALASQMASQQQALSAAETADAARRDAEKVRDERRMQRDEAMASVHARGERLAKFAEGLAGLRAAREAAARTRDQAEKAFQTALVELTPLFDGITEARAAWDRNAVAFRKSLADGAAAFFAVEKRIGELGALIREADAALTPASEAVARAEGDERAKRIAEAEARAACETVRAQRAALLRGRAADVVEDELSTALRRAMETRDLRAAELDKAGNQLTAAVEGVNCASKSLADLAERLSVASAALDAWLAGFAERIGRHFGRDELETALARDEAWTKAERAALDAIERAIRTAEGALGVHRRNLAEHLASRPTTDDEATVAAGVTTHRTVVAETGQRRDTTRAFLLADDQRIKSNAEIAGQITSRRAVAEPWLKLNDLIGSSDGAKFRGIAQRRTLDILLGYANAQLEQLATRYRLERLPESLNLIVVDRDMGDERRSVHSLSGGESFLVSLALALALASLTSNRLRIESLFIDEGFGCLDPETLNTAMNALMHLEAQGRKVGVISHVSEMTDAIPVQIRLVKGRSGASRLVVPGAQPPHGEIPDVTQAETASSSPKCRKPGPHRGGPGFRK